MRQQSIFNRVAIIFSLIVGTMITATPWTVSHAAASEARQVSVAVSDLDLGTPDGVRVLDHRVGRAARKVCGGAFRPLDVEWTTCVRDAVNRARPQRDTLLSRAHPGRRDRGAF